MKFLFSSRYLFSKKPHLSLKASIENPLAKIGMLTGLAVATMLLFPSSVKAVTTTLNFNQTPLLVSGTPLSQGAVYRFPSVTPGVDAMVQITTISNAQLKLLDDNTTFAARFQPTIAPTSASLTNSQSYVRFDFKLTPASTPVGTTFAAAPTTTATNVYFSAQDVDGNGTANTIREFVETIGATTSYIANPTFLQSMASLPVPGGIGYEQSNSTNVQAGIGTDDRYEFYSFLGTSVTTFSIVGGNITSATGCLLNNTGCDRQNSWTFDVADVQKLDFGDAPAGYGNAYHPVPLSPTVYLGTSVDGDDGPNYTSNADGDDTTGIDDENGVASFPVLSTVSTSYSLNVACAGSGTIAGWIDFNQNGVFNASERASGTCSGTSVTLNWTGLSGLSIGNTYARFRISSIASEVANPTGQSSNGEVEDYQLAIAAPVSVSGTVYHDADSSANNTFTNIKTGSETGTNAGGLNALLVNVSGNIIASTPVNTDGTYNFSVAPAQNNVTIRLSTTAGTVGSAAPAASVPATWTNTSPLTTAAFNIGTTSITAKDFGIRLLPNISGTLYQDSDGGNDFDSGEPNLPANITVRLLNNTGTITIATTTTNANGQYTFVGVANGNYIVQVDTSNPDISSNLTLGTPNNFAVNVAGSSVSNINFGFDLSQSCSTLFGTGTDGTNNRIYTLNPTAGASFPSNLSFATNASARDPITGKIFYIEANSNNPKVATWDPATGTNAIINPTGFSTSVGVGNNYVTRAGFRADGALFVMTSNAFLYELNRNGTLKTSFGQVKQTGGVDIATSGGDLSFDSQGIMWLVSGGFLYVVDLPTPSSARAIEIGSLVSVPRVDGLAFVPNGTYYAHSSNTKATYTINTTTGLATATGGSVPSSISITDLSSCVYPTINLISGTLYQDGNGDNTFNSGETTQPANITVRLINASNNAVVATTTTRTGGTYIFSNVANGSYKVQVDTSDSDIPATHKTLGTPNDLAVTVNNNNTTNVNFGFDRTTPILLLVKRITAINGDRTQNLNDGTLLNTFVNDSSSTNDDDPHWFDRNTYLIGAINGGRVKPGDEIEYTIYFLNTQAASLNVAICDLVPTQATFVSTGYNTASPHPTEAGALPADTGLGLALDANTLPTTPTFYLTNTNDSDRGRYYPPSDPSTPSTCKQLDAQNNPISSGAAANTNGAIVVEIVRGTGIANQLPPATAAGTPPNSYGFIRFKAKVQ